MVLGWSVAEARRQVNEAWCAENYRRCAGRNAGPELAESDGRSEVQGALANSLWFTIPNTWPAQIQNVIHRAQLQQHDEQDHNRYQHALETLLLAEKEANKLIEESKAAIAEHEEKGDVLKKEAATLRELRNPQTVEHSSSDKGKGKAPERDNSPSSDADSEDDDLPKTPAGQEHGIKRRALQHRLRECNVTLHRVKFLQGDVYHVLGGQNSTAEDEAYAAAEGIRRSLLKSEYNPVKWSLVTND